jgi:hypothetical protein
MWDNILLASRPMPNGYTAQEAFDHWIRLTQPSICFDQATRDKMMQAGHLAPFISGNSAQIDEGTTWRSDDRMVIGWQFYLPETKSFIFMHEDYGTRQLCYSISALPDVRYFMQGPYDVYAPLSPNANRDNYNIP